MLSNNENAVPASAEPEPQADSTVDLFLRILSREGHSPSPTSAILDFGCGAGQMVRALQHRGYKAWGADLIVSPTEPDRTLRHISADSYRLPFEDHSFDLVISSQVLEHVQDHDLAFKEIARVLKPGGATLHIFPSRFSLIERHTFVPFAGVIRSRAYLKFWAALGIRNDFQKGLSAAETAEHNQSYLETGTNYLSRRNMQAIAQRYFSHARFCENTLLSEHPNETYRRISWIPGLGIAYGLLRGNVLATVK